MGEDFIKISWLNDFIFCPASIYFHQLYGEKDKTLYQTSDQLNGTKAHRTVDAGTYSTRKAILQGVSVICLQYRLLGKIDYFNVSTGVLTERKKRINKIYDGYVFQLYGQYFSLIEMGYQVKKIRFHSMDDNKIYNIDIPENDIEMLSKFELTINAIRSFSMEGFQQVNIQKCRRCIYEPACDRTLL